MNNPLISVIVPVYKAEAYLDKCVNSIRNQTYKNLEIILVDDGSPDRCGEMCDAFAKQDPRIRVIHKENSGAASARNVGLDVASGEYIGFADSDDWVEPDLYERLLPLLVENEAQISACGIQCDYADGRVVYYNDEYPLKSQTSVFLKIDALRELIAAKKITTSFCDKLFCRNIFETLRFQEGMVNEDFDLIPKCIEMVDRLAYDPKPLYHYRMSEESVTRGGFKKSRLTEAKVSRNHMAYYKEHYPQLYRASLAKHIEICMNLVQASAENTTLTKERNELINEVKSFKASTFFSLLDKKNKVKFILFSFNVKLFTWCMTRYYNNK